MFMFCKEVLPRGKLQICTGRPVEVKGRLSKAASHKETEGDQQLQKKCIPVMLKIRVAAEKGHHLVKIAHSSIGEHKRALFLLLQALSRAN